MDEWVVEFCDEFDLEFEGLTEDIKSSLIQHKVWTVAVRRFSVD